MTTAEQNFQLLKEIEANRDFLLSAYEQNPELLKHAEPRIKQLFDKSWAQEGRFSEQSPFGVQRGISLIELIIFIVIISVALTGILLVMNQVTRDSADPLIHKQAIAAAESLLEEIELQDFMDANDGVTAVCPVASAVSVTNRSTDYHIIDCYRAFNMPSPPGIYALNDGVTPITGLTGYGANVAIVNEALGSVASAVRITVTVTDPQGLQISIDGYRTAY